MQQINLYLPEFQPRREPLQALHILARGRRCIGADDIANTLRQLAKQRHRGKLAAQQSELQQLETQAQALRAARPKSQKLKYDRELDRLTKEVSRRERIERLIADQNLGNASGFSAQLEAMARQHITDLSLERFDLKRGGSYVELSGWTRNAETVPLYLQRLRDESSFESVGFGVLSIERKEERRDALHFRIGQPEEDAS